jgi:hypothetical protein
MVQKVCKRWKRVCQKVLIENERNLKGEMEKKKKGIIEKNGYKWWNSKRKDLKRFLNLEGGRFKVCKRWSNIWEMFERGLKLEKGS